MDADPAADDRAAYGRAADDPAAADSGPDDGAAADGGPDDGAAADPRQESRRYVASDAQAKALASSLRLRILRMTLDEALTNREIAERLGRNPATVLHHVRTLVDAGFLRAGEVRRGTRGAREIPYRATGRSWFTDVPEQDLGQKVAAMVQAFVQESAAVAPELIRVTRLGLRLTPAERDELEARLQALVTEYAARALPADPADPADATDPADDAPLADGPRTAPPGEPWSLFLALHPDPGRT